jgi:hypothetical protein
MEGNKDSNLPWIPIDSGVSLNQPPSVRFGDEIPVMLEVPKETNGESKLPSKTKSKSNRKSAKKSMIGITEAFDASKIAPKTDDQVMARIRKYSMAADPNQLKDELLDVLDDVRDSLAKDEKKEAEVQSGQSKADLDPPKSDPKSEGK